MEQRANTAKGLSIAGAVLGAWLIISPFIFFAFTAVEAWNSVIVGIVVAALALVRLAMPSQNWANMASGVAGLWLIVSPFFLTFLSTSAYWNTIILGLVIAVVGFTGSSITVGTGHGHTPRRAGV